MVIGLSLCLFGQETVKQKEAGILFRDFDNFGLTYRFGTIKSMWRINAMSLSGNTRNETQDSLQIDGSNIGLGIRIGKEFHKSLTEKLELRYGADLMFDLYYNKSDFDDQSLADSDLENSSLNTNQGISFVLGFNYIINDHFILGVEVNPNISYMYSKAKTWNSITDIERENIRDGIYWNASGSSVLFTLAYRY